jgi:trimethylamine-N-oxide reductase cytochrome c-type subunit TorC
VRRLKITELIRKNKKTFALAIAVLAILSYFGYNYTQNNPKFCTTCHLMNEAYETWEVSVMHELNCHKCHETDLIESLNHVREVIFEKPTKVTKLTEVDNEVCKSCHAINNPQWPQVVNTTGHELHFFGSNQPPDCIDCHGLRLHDFVPPEETCEECHGEIYEQSVEDMDIHCLVCHEFTVLENKLIPERGDCLDCHESQETMGVSFPADAHTDTPCMNCHNPHEEEQYTECSVCHDVSTKGLHTESAHANCTACHTPHSLVPMRDNCLSCHIDKTEHFAPTDCASCHSGS